MERIDIRTFDAAAVTRIRQVDQGGDAVPLVDGDEPVAWLVPHHEYATLLALGHRARRATADERDDVRDVARAFEERKAANLSVQEAYSLRQQLWTIKA